MKKMYVNSIQTWSFFRYVQFLISSADREHKDTQDWLYLKTQGFVLKFFYSNLSLVISKYQELSSNWECTPQIPQKCLVPEKKGGVVDHKGRYHPLCAAQFMWDSLRPSPTVQSCQSFCPYLPCQSLNSVDPGDIFAISIENSTFLFTTHVWTGHCSSDHRPVVQAAKRKQHSIFDRQKVTNCPCHGLMIGPGWLSERHIIKCKFSNKNK